MTANSPGNMRQILFLSLIFYEVELSYSSPLATGRVLVC